MKKLLLPALLAASAAAAAPSVTGSKHDLSLTGPGPIRATSETSACAFCHFPHSGLSNRPDPAAIHVPYESSTLAVRPGAPTGASRACLSCHDGTIAVGQTTGRYLPVNVGAIPAGRPSNLGTDLRKTHPISTFPSLAGGTRPPRPGDEVKLDRNGFVQCTSCHDPHRERGDPVVGKFLVKPSQRSALCLSCHDAVATGGSGGSHATSVASLGPAGGPHATVGEAGCAACHVPHGGDGRGHLLDRPLLDDDAVCLRCHGGGVASKNVGAELAKPFAHVTPERGVHDPSEGRPGSARPLPETSPAARRHVACVDCHDPHRATGVPAVRPGVGGALAGVWGVDQAGQRVDQVRFEYELCLKCHGDSANAGRPSGRAAPPREGADANLRLAFGPDAASSHPVLAPGRGAGVPSLLPQVGPGATIGCGDCHASESGPGAGGSGPAGPHGSVHPFLLERAYLTADLTPESPAAFALCYKCHDREVILSARSNFSGHALHLGPSVNAPCSACHTAHGVSARRGAPGANAHLMDFDVSIVRPPAIGPRRYRSEGPGRGSCNLSCHGREHADAPYGPSVLP